MSPDCHVLARLPNLPMSMWYIIVWFNAVRWHIIYYPIPRGNGSLSFVLNSAMCQIPQVCFNIGSSCQMVLHSMLLGAAWS